MRGMKIYNESTSQKSFRIELLVIFAILVALGFPGNLTAVFGDRLGTLMEYSAFFIEIAVMLISSGNNWLEIQVINLDKKYLAIYLYIAFIFIESMLVARYPSLEFITVTRLAVTALFAIWIQEYFSFRRMVELICIAQALFIILTIGFTAAYPGLAFESGEGYANAFCGLYATKNTNAAQLVFGIAISIYLIYQKARALEPTFWWIVLAVIQILMLALCQATGPIFCLILVLTVLLLPDYARVPVGWLFVIGSVAFLFLALTLMPAFAWFFDAIGKDATLTGRIPLWNRIIDVMIREGGNIFTGWGYGMFWRDELAVNLIHSGFDENSFFGTMTTGAHNLVMEYWLNSGLFGLAAFFGCCIFSLRRVKEFPNGEYRFTAMIMAFLMINGFTERAMGGNYAYKDLAFLIIMAIGLKCSNQLEQSLDKQRKAVMQINEARNRRYCDTEKT